VLLEPSHQTLDHVAPSVGGPAEAGRTPAPPAPLARGDTLFGERLSGGEKLVLSISVGARRYAGEDDFRELLAKAAAAMYQAKREGRAWVLAG